MNHKRKPRKPAVVVAHAVEQLKQLYASLDNLSVEEESHTVVGIEERLSILEQKIEEIEERLKDVEER